MAQCWDQRSLPLPVEWSCRLHYVCMTVITAHHIGKAPGVCGMKQKAQLCSCRFPGRHQQSDFQSCSRLQTMESWPAVPHDERQALTRISTRMCCSIP